MRQEKADRENNRFTHLKEERSDKENIDVQRFNILVFSIGLIEVHTQNYRQETESETQHNQPEFA